MKRAAELPFVVAALLSLLLVLSSVAVVAVPDGGGANNNKKDDDPVLLDLRSFSPPPGSSSGAAAVDQQPHGVSVDLALRTLDDEVRRDGRQGQQQQARGQRGRSALHFLTALASSESFVQDAWRKRPVLIKSRTVSEVQAQAAAAAADDDAGSNDSDDSSAASSEEECWSSGLFTLQDDLLPGLDGTYGVPAQRTSDAVRDGSKADTWSKNVPLPEGGTHRQLFNNLYSRDSNRN